MRGGELSGNRSRCTQRGSATVYALGAVAVLTAAALAALGFTGLATAKHRAAAAADLAALAGASAVTGGGAPCESAAEIAARNRASLTSCRVDGPVVEVAVRVRGPSLLGLSPVLRASARAGPSALPGG